MLHDHTLIEPVSAFLEEWCGVPGHAVALTVKPLRGGLESGGVLNVAARWHHNGHPGACRFVVKCLVGRGVREAAAYQHLIPAFDSRIAPALLGVRWLGEDRCLLFLEALRPADRWPWRKLGHTEGVLKVLARLHHEVSPEAFTPLRDWNYERDLLQRAWELLELFEAQGAHLGALRRATPALGRVVEALPRLRRQLMTFQPLGAAVIHGDVHSANVVVTSPSDEDPEVRLIDWGRARLGSPLEDVSSWLQSLRFWEPEALRRHDTLLRSYLEARGLSDRLTRDLRDAYWLAAASNSLAGALAYHVTMSIYGETPAERAGAAGAARDQLRIIRRADACFN